MKLIRLQVENFGTLQDFRLDFSDGLNVLHEKNGWGKSTLAVFIKAMLYGLPATSKRSLDENERKKYIPWQGGAFGGSLEFECEKGRFRIERFFADKESGDQFALYDLSTNKLSDAFSPSVGEELFGIDADGFERSTYLSQREGYGRSENISIQTKLGDLLEDVNDMGNYDVALEMLEKSRRFYQMTGNRGAIADEQKKTLTLKAELEACARVEEEADKKREERRACTEEIARAEEEEKRLQKKHEQMLRAMERQALLEEKGRMLSELADLEARKKKAETVFCGFIPSEEELNAARKALDSIRDANAALRTIPETHPDIEELNSLHELFAKGAPRAEEIDAQIAAADRLRRMREKQKWLADELAAISTDPRFVDGVPTPEAFESGITSLDLAKRAQIEKAHAESQLSDRMQVAAKKRRTRMLCAGGAALVGLCIAILSFLAEGTLATVLLIAGALALVLGGALTLLFSRKSEEIRITEQANATANAKNKQYSEEMLKVEKLFASCHTQPEGDLYRQLTELSIAAVQARENVHKRRRLREQLDELGRVAEAQKARLASYLSPYDQEASEGEFVGVLTALRRDVDRYQALRRESARYAAQRQVEEAKKEALQAELRPFLKRYDNTGSRLAGDIVSSISDSFVEYRALCGEYKSKEQALRAFIAEKQLDRVPVEENVISPEAQAAEERALQQKLSELRDRYTRLSMELERLATETDRIPDLEAALLASQTRLETYTKNFKTVTATAKLLAESKEALLTRYLDGMQESFARYLSALDGEDAPEAVLDSSFDVSTRVFGKSRAMESFSRGSRDLVRFCVRLSLTEELYREGEKPFLLLDDPFVNLDEEHLAAAQRLLDALAQSYQIVHMVCHEGRV